MSIGNFVARQGGAITNCEIRTYQDERLTEAPIRRHKQHEQRAEDLELNSAQEECKVRSKAKVRSALRSLLAAVNTNPALSAEVYSVDRPGMG